MQVSDSTEMVLLVEQGKQVMIVQTTADEVIEHFAISRVAKEALESWRSGRPEVADVVLGHTTAVPYRVRLDEMYEASVQTEHALGDIRSADVRRIASIRDWNPNFAFTHLFHYVLESRGRPFTYGEFREFAKSSVGKSMLSEEAWEAVRHATESGSNISLGAARDAMQWRVGNAYYSFLRELIVFGELRKRGLDLRLHPLADALFRVDAWIGSTVVCLYIGNSQFRSGTRGRKPRVEQLLGPDFSFVHIHLPNQRKFGVLYLPTQQELDAAAKEIAEASRG